MLEKDQKSLLVIARKHPTINVHNLKTFSNKKRRDTKLTTRRFEDILFSLSSDRKNTVLKFKGANIGNKENLSYIRSFKFQH